jgi:hypothetical protein
VQRKTCLKKSAFLSGFAVVLDLVSNLYDIYMYFAEKNMYFVCVYYCCMFVLKFTRNIAFDTPHQFEYM